MEHEAREYRCLTCRERTKEPMRRDLYACGACGTTYTRPGSADGTGSRCPECHRFGRRLDRHCCPACERGELAEIEYRACMLCGQEHDTTRRPVECGGHGERGRPLLEVKTAPGVDSSADLMLPADMFIVSVDYWLNDDRMPVRRWRLGGRSQRRSSECIITGVMKPLEPERVSLTCEWCRKETVGSMADALSRLAQGAHRHGDRGLETAGPDAQVPTPPYGNGVKREAWPDELKGAQQPPKYDTSQ